MIKSIRHKGLKLLWEQRDGSKLPSGQAFRIQLMLEVIDSANQIPGDFAAFKNWHIHKLSGLYREFWSVKVDKNYRIIFRHDGQHAWDVDNIDYH